MELLTMIFATLCVTLYSGGEDCSYLYTEVQQEQLLVMHASAGGDTQKYMDGNQTLAGFVYATDKKMFILPDLHESYINHEKKHVICQLEYERHGVNDPFCKGHFRV